MIRINPSKRFVKKLDKLTERNEQLRSIIRKLLKQLARSPFEKNLCTHKVDTSNFGKRYSSRVTGDVRIIWDFGDREDEIILLDVGGHSGRRGVYRTFF